MTIDDVEEHLESALTADADDRGYFIRQALQLLCDDREDAPQLHAIRHHLEQTLDLEGDDALSVLREAVGMLAEYRLTGDVHDAPVPLDDAHGSATAQTPAGPEQFDDRDPDTGLPLEYPPSAATVDVDAATMNATHRVEQTVTVELPEEFAKAVAYRLGIKAARGGRLTQFEVDEMAMDYGVAIEEFTVAPDGQPLAEWLQDKAGLQVSPPDSCKESAQTLGCQTDSLRGSGGDCSPEE